MAQDIIPIRFQTLNKYAILPSNAGGFPLGYILALDGELVLFGWLSLLRKILFTVGCGIFVIIRTTIRGLYPTPKLHLMSVVKVGVTIGEGS